MTRISGFDLGPGDARRWTDTSLATEERLALLMAEMTVQEKLSQLGSAWNNARVSGLNVAPQQDVFTRLESWDEARKTGLGHITRAYGTRPQDPLDAAQYLAGLQQDLLDNTRLGIPAIAHEECLTGFTTYRATIYPSALAWAATFNPDLVSAMAAAIGSDMRDGGVHQGLAPVLDVVRDHRWGRVEETMGEDPYLVGVMGSAYVRGLQSAGVIATLKHFAGYSSSQAGRNHAPVHMGPRELREIMLVPFEMAIRAGAGSVMNSYAEIDGVPCAANVELLTGVLREAWGFTGTVVADYWSIAFLESMHKVAQDPVHAGAIALAAGIDVELPDRRSYGAGLLQLILAGEVPMEPVDRAVERVLRQKFELGLLSAGWSPLPAGLREGSLDLDSPRNRTIARTMAEQSIVLLQNDRAILPLLDQPRRIALVGPCADDVNTFFGCYSFPNHVLPSYAELGNGVEAFSLRHALEAELANNPLSYDAGCGISSADTSGISNAVEAARDADLCIVAVGDKAGLFGRGTSGEGCDVEDLTLPGVQGTLVDALLATGTPTILIVVSGRPYALGAYAQKCAAILQAFFPGEEGGPALARVLTGAVTPSGKLPVQIAKTSGINPSTYLHPHLGGASDGVSILDPTPEFHFGHGLSYTTFDYSEVTASALHVDIAGSVGVSVRVRNTGIRRGTEIVQVYVQDPVAPVTRPELQLIAFGRATLESGGDEVLHFEIHTDRFAFVGPDLQWVVEPGEIRLFVGSSSVDIRAALRITISGDARIVGTERQLITPVRVST